MRQVSIFNVDVLEVESFTARNRLGETFGPTVVPCPGKPSAVRKDSFLKHSLLSAHATASSLPLIPYMCLAGWLFTGCSIEPAVKAPYA